MRLGATHCRQLYDCQKNACIDILCGTLKTKRHPSTAEQLVYFWQSRIQAEAAVCRYTQVGSLVSYVWLL